MSKERPLFSKIVAGLKQKTPDKDITTYVEKLRTAYQRMRDQPGDLGLVAQANRHRDAKVALHSSPYFLPWHRAMLYFHERILGALVNDTDFRLPVWDWEAQGGSAIPEFMSECPATNPLFDPTRVAKIGDMPSQQDMMDAWAGLLSMERVEFAGAFYGITWENGDIPPQKTQAGECMGVPHNTFHNWVDGHMKTFDNSGLDPLFYMHHCGVDRIWAHRQFLQPTTHVKDFVDLPCDHVIRNLTMDFIDCEGVIPNLKPVAVKKAIWEFADYSKLGYAYQFPLINPAPPLTAYLLRDILTRSNQNVLRIESGGRIEISLVASFPMNLSGVVNMELLIGNQWVPIGSAPRAGHCAQASPMAHHMAGERVWTSIRGKITAPIELAPESLTNVEGRWSNKYECGPMPVTDIKILQ